MVLSLPGHRVPCKGYRGGHEFGGGGGRLLQTPNVHGLNQDYGPVPNAKSPEPSSHGVHAPLQYMLGP